MRVTSEAQRDARVRLRDAADHVAAVLERLEERETELSQVIGGLRSEAGRLAADIHILREAAADAQSDSAPSPGPPPSADSHPPSEGSPSRSATDGADAGRHGEEPQSKATSAEPAPGVPIRERNG